ncbi:Glycosyltransferase like family 2 [Thalassovita gelatinovora]|nr:Glycosyltransferase like family 2 [Thalassovita gelatinovora]
MHVLINDEDCPRLRQLMQSQKHVHVHCENKNLGVAGGRNYLIDKARAGGAEFFISCDTDIIFPTDYFSRLRDAYLRLQATDPDLGYVQPVLLNGPSVAGCFPELQVNNWAELATATERDDSWRKGMWATVKRELGEEEAIAAIFHTGVSNIWRAHFDTPRDPKAFTPWKSDEFTSIFRTTYPSLRSEAEKLSELIKQGKPVRIMSTAGGVTAFHIAAMDRSGAYNDLFNPFAFEDSELGFRSTMSGLNNYLLPDLFAIHDVFLGDNNRSPMYHARIGVLRGAEIAGFNLSDEETGFALSQSMVVALRPIMTRFLNTSVNQLGETSEVASNRLPSLFLSYFYELARGMLDAVSKHDIYSLPNRADLLKVMAGFCGTASTVVDFTLPLAGANLRADKVEAKTGAVTNGLPIYALSAVNCRIEEPTSEGILNSRYFDLYSRISHIGNNRFLVKIDVQSDDVLYKLELRLSYKPETAAKDGILAIEDFSIFSKKHDYGAFSDEDIYPKPTLYSSKVWCPFVFREIAAARKTTNHAGVHGFLKLLIRYLQLGQDKQTKTEEVKAPVAPSTPSNVKRDKPVSKSGKRKILIFTDSRGQHKPAGTDHDIFAERLAKDDRLDVDVYLCPMKWTMTTDFLNHFPKEKLAEYDHVILYTGIVEWSPRPAKSALEDLYDNPNSINENNLGLNTRDYSKKIVNNKKAFLDNVFGADSMARHLASPHDTEYEGQKTNNMYSLEMAQSKLLPRLKQIPNLIFISANRFVKGWEGDFKRGRPANIDLTHRYSDLFATELKNAGIPVVDLRSWNDAEIQEYTCDNIHLTKVGSDYIYDQLAEIMNLKNTQSGETHRIDFQIPDYRFEGFKLIETITPNKRPKIMAAAKCTDPYLATLIIGVRHNPSSPERLDNLRFLLNWIDHYYGDLFDVLLIEQDEVSRLDLKDLNAKSYVRHAFLYNPAEYNRGWGYNVAVKHHCPDAKVVALMDTDVLTGTNFLRDIIDCHDKIDVASPYMNIYYTDSAEAAKVKQTMDLTPLNDIKRIKNPVTVAGGIVIWNRTSYMGIKGFEQYVGYSCEDRAMDVTIFNHIDKSRIRISPQTYVHLYHASDQAGRVRFDEILAHLNKEYSCVYDKNLSPFDFIHKNCRHVSRSKTIEMMLKRTRDFGDPELYRCGVPLTINGLRQTVAAEVRGEEAIFPPDFKGLEDYPEREIYANMPAPDTEDLRALHNQFQGERCFIIGNGPSLNKHDLSLLEGEYSFGVNSFYYKTRDSGFRPTFYVVEDSSVMKENIEEIRAYEAPFKFFPTLYKRLHPEAPNTFFFEMNRGFYERSSPNYAVPRFSTDASRVLYCGQSVTYINLQLAFFMGFTEVHLIGMDFDYVIPKSHKRKGDVLLSDTDDPNHFHKDYFGKGKTWKDPKLERVLMNYRQADIAYSAVNRKIYNATIGGKLEVFDRADYNLLLRDPETGQKRKERIAPPVTQPGSLRRQMGLEEAMPTVPGSAAAGAISLPALAAQLMLDPAGMVPRVMPGGDLAAEIDALLATKTPAADHFVKVRDWAQGQVRKDGS